MVELCRSTGGDDVIGMLDYVQCVAVIVLLIIAARDSGVTAQSPIEVCR